MDGSKTGETGVSAKERTSVLMSKVTVEFVNSVLSWYRTISEPKEQKNVLSMIVPASSIVTAGLTVNVTEFSLSRTRGEVVDPLLEVSDRL